MLPLSPRNNPGVIDRQPVGERTDTPPQKKRLTREEFNLREAERDKKSAELQRQFEVAFTRFEQGMEQREAERLANRDPHVVAVRIRAVSNEIWQKLNTLGAVGAFTVTVTWCILGAQAALITALFFAAIWAVTYIANINYL